MNLYEKQLKELLFGKNGKFQFKKIISIVRLLSILIDLIDNENDPLFSAKKFYNQSESSLESLLTIR